MMFAGCGNNWKRLCLWYDRMLSGCVDSQMFNDVIFIFVVVFHKWTFRKNEEIYFISLQGYKELCRTDRQHCQDN
jgi:hypothetical protein